CHQIAAQLLKRPLGCAVFVQCRLGAGGQTVPGTIIQKIGLRRCSQSKGQPQGGGGQQRAQERLRAGGHPSNTIGRTRPPSSSQVGTGSPLSRRNVGLYSLLCYRVP